MRNLVLTSLMVAALPAPAGAQSQKEICAMLAAPMIQSSDAMASLASALDRLDVSALLPKLSGEVQTEFEALDASRLQLAPVLAAFLDQLEQTAMATRRCAR